MIDAADKMSVSRRERDTDNRSELQVMGWRVLECTDKDLESASGVQKQVRRISQMIRQLRKAGSEVGPVAASADNTQEQSSDTGVTPAPVAKSSTLTLMTFQSSRTRGLDRDEKRAVSAPIRLRKRI